MGAAYSLFHATRPATIGLALDSSPLALLAWIGEKFLSWSDVDPSLETILESVSLYWFTESMGRGVFPYRIVSFSTLPFPSFPNLHISSLPFPPPFFSTQEQEKRTLATDNGDVVGTADHSNGRDSAPTHRAGPMWHISRNRLGTAISRRSSYPAQRLGRRGRGIWCSIGSTRRCVLFPAIALASLLALGDESLSHAVLTL
jgi:hypothetical protein